MSMMRVYMTNGTLPFLIKLEERYPGIQFYFMKNEQGVLAYYEGTKKKVFSAGRTYEALYGHENIRGRGFVVMDHIPIQSDSKPVFEEQLPKLKRELQQAPGLLALRLLKERIKNHYVVLCKWDKRSSYTLWKEQRQDLSVKNPAYFLNRRFTSSYHIISEEDLAELENNLGKKHPSG